MGLKVTVKFAHLAGNIVTGSVADVTNCETDEVIPVTVILVVPMLYTVKVCGPLTVPAICGVKESPVGSTEADVPANAVRVETRIVAITATRRQTLPTDI